MLVFYEIVQWVIYIKVFLQVIAKHFNIIFNHFNGAMTENFLQSEYVATIENPLFTDTRIKKGNLNPPSHQLSQYCNPPNHLCAVRLGGIISFHIGVFVSVNCLGRSFSTIKASRQTLFANRTQWYWRINHRPLAMLPRPICRRTCPYTLLLLPRQRQLYAR